MQAIGLFLALEILGYAIDAVWHGLVNPRFEPTSVGDMALHLATVHLPLYLGVAGFFTSIAIAAGRRARRGAASPTWWVALAGATIQVIGESWHAYTHLRLAPDAAVPGVLSLVGFVIAVAALGVAWRRRTAVASRTRRAA